MWKPDENEAGEPPLGRGWAAWRITLTVQGDVIANLDFEDYHQEARIMPMKNPPHPGEIIREDVIRALGLSLTRAAKILGVRRATLSEVANGKSSVSAEMALHLEKAFGVSMDLLLKMQAGYDAAQGRLHGSEINVRRHHRSAARP